MAQDSEPEQHLPTNLQLILTYLQEKRHSNLRKITTYIGTCREQSGSSSINYVPLEFYVKRVLKKMVDGNTVISKKKSGKQQFSLNLDKLVYDALRGDETVQKRMYNCSLYYIVKASLVNNNTLVRYFETPKGHFDVEALPTRLKKMVTKAFRRALHQFGLTIEDLSIFTEVDRKIIASHVMKMTEQRKL